MHPDIDSEQWRLRVVEWLYIVPSVLIVVNMGAGRVVSGYGHSRAIMGSLKA